MTRFSELSVDAVANGYDFTQFSVVADVGGGHGRLLATILAAAHDSRGILYDLPSVVDGAGPTLEAAGVKEDAPALAARSSMPCPRAPTPT